MESSLFQSGFHSIWCLTNDLSYRIINYFSSMSLQETNSPEHIIELLPSLFCISTLSTTSSIFIQVSTLHLFEFLECLWHEQISSKRVHSLLAFNPYRHMLLHMIHSQYRFNVDVNIQQTPSTSLFIHAEILTYIIIVFSILMLSKNRDQYLRIASFQVLRILIHVYH